MQDINKWQRERERAITNTRDLFRGSSTLALYPRLRHYEGYPLCSIPMDHSSVPQHLQTLGLSSPVYTASPPARRGRTSNKSSHTNSKQPRTHSSVSSRNKKRSLGDLNTLITNEKLSLQHSYKMNSNEKLKCLCEKTRIESYGEKLKKSLLTHSK